MNEITTQTTIEARLAVYYRQAEGAFSPATMRALRSDTALFAAWCSERSLEAIPADPDSVAAYIRDRAETLAPATIARHVTSIGHLHRAAGLVDPTKENAPRLALKAIRKAKGTAQRQAAAITGDVLARIEGALQAPTLRDLRDMASLHLARDAMLRRSELVAIDVADLHRAEDGTGTLTIRRSKTDQEGAGAVQFVGSRAMAAIDRYLAAAGISEGPLFRSIRKGGHVQAAGIEGGDVSRAWKRLAQAAGLDPAAISGHSARVGMAQDLVAAGADLPGVMQAGRWSSPAMPARYARHQAARRGAVAKLHGEC